MRNDQQPTCQRRVDKTTLDYYNEFEQTILKKVFQDAYRNNLKTYDLIDHIDHMASEYDLTQSPSYWSIRTALRRFSGHHRALINGSVGERRALNAIKHASSRKRVLPNVRLEHDGELIEIDYVAITQAGIFCIEVKNYSYDLFISSDGAFRNSEGESYNDYNIGERMSANKYVLGAILSERLEGGFNTGMFCVLLNASRAANIRNKFPHIDLCSLGNVATYIDSVSIEGNYPTDSRIDEIAECIESARYEFAETQPYDFIMISEKLNSFISEIENAVQVDIGNRIQTKTTEGAQVAGAVNPGSIHFERLEFAYVPLLLGQYAEPFFRKYFDRTLTSYAIERSQP